MKSFKTESKKILELMINSIYTNKEIFLRELISNASDAIDKLYFQSLTGKADGISVNDFEIGIKYDKKKKTITISDNGIGMNKDELDNNLGVIARSGSEEFKNANSNDEISIIGQFGVGFYSSFMVAKKVEVLSKKYGETEAHKWISNGVDGYDIKDAEKESHGSEITLYLKDDTDDENYSKFLEEYQIKNLIKKYSDFIRYPIKMEVTKYETEGEGEDAKSVEKKEIDTINTMTPLWKKNKKDITEDEYNNFYKTMFYDSENPLKVMHFVIEGRIEYRAIVFIPAKAPYNYYSKEYEKGLKLYTNGVLITDKCASLLPDHLSFVKGVVDADLPLNISRETMQDSKEVQIIASTIEKKVLDELKNMMVEDREKYEKFFDAFGLQLKFSIYKSYGMDKDKLQDLLLFDSLKLDKKITLKEYVDAKLENQKAIYYASGATTQIIKNLPQVDNALSQEYDCLGLTEEVDEFALKFIYKYNDLDIENVTTIKLEDEIDTEDSKELKDFLITSLNNKVKNIKFTDNLKNHAVALSSEGDMSLEMEKTLNKQAIKNDVKADRVLLINKESEVYSNLANLYNTDQEKLKDFVNILYNEACILAGVEVENPKEFAELLNKYLK